MAPFPSLTPGRWRQVRAILDAVLELPDPAGQSEFLSRACAADTELRAEVESLLSQTTSPLEACAAGTRLPPNDPSPPALAGRRVGAWVLERELGRGGMGTVWLARRADGRFQQSVALKLLKRGTDTEEVLRRFRAERQILARLEHPNIARLLDGGEAADGLPWLPTCAARALPWRNGWCCSRKSARRWSSPTRTW